jgi:hypothetical protein
MKHGRGSGNILRLWEWLHRWCTEVWAQLWVGICGTTLGNPLLNGGPWLTILELLNPRAASRVLRLESWPGRAGTAACASR